MADNRIRLTLKRISDFPHPVEGKAFLWDTEAPSLAVLASPNRKNYIFEARLNGKTIRITLGDVKSYILEDARTEANRLKALVGQGIDPRVRRMQIIEEQEAIRAARLEEDAVEQVKCLPTSDVWREYLEERKPRWSALHYRDHIALSQPGGAPAKNGAGVTKPGPLAPLMALTLAELNAARIETWLTKEVDDRATQASLAYRLLRAFLNWCSRHERYGLVVDSNVLNRRIAETLPKKTARADCLMREQLPAWFGAVRQIQNPVVCVYLQGLLLTGARRRELSGLRWENVDFRWKSLALKDKVEGERVIPLTPYFESLLRWLPRRNEWVFSSRAADGRLKESLRAHQKALAVAGIDHLSLHGLRRSFGSLSEWTELPVGVVAQIMGHKPSATAERHYRVRPLDLLRKWHIKLEEWILEQSGVEIPTEKKIGECVRNCQTGGVRCCCSGEEWS